MTEASILYACTVSRDFEEPEDTLPNFSLPAHFDRAGARAEPEGESCEETKTVCGPSWDESQR